MGTRTAAYRDGRVIFIRAVMDEALAKFIADAIIVVRGLPQTASSFSHNSKCMPCRHALLLSVLAAQSFRA